MRPTFCAFLLIATDVTPLPIPSEFAAAGRDLVVAGVLFWFYRQLSLDFRKIVQDNTAALQKLSDRIEQMGKDQDRNLKPFSASS